MSIATRTTILLLLSLCLLAASSEAATYVVPRDAELVARADAIVVATAMRSRAVAAAGGGIRTVFELQVTEVVKGPFTPGSTVAIVEEGGALAGRFALVVGSPRYVEGQEYLVFLEANVAGEYRTLGLGLGQFAFKADPSGQRYLTRPAGICGVDTNYEAHIELDRKAEEFIGYVRTISRGAVPAEDDYLFRRSALPMETNAVQSDSFSRNSYLMQVPGFGGFRWQSPQFGYSVANATAAEEGVAQGAASVWAGAGGSGISVSATPTTNDTLPGANVEGDDGQNVMRFSDQPVGAAGLARVYGGSLHQLDGEQFISISETDISIAPAFGTCSDVVAHEVGHSLGFRHSTEDCSATAECSSDALMQPVLSGCNGSLHAWDINAAATVYGAGPAPCANPAITAQPQGSTIQEGSSATLTVTATGTSPTYQWYLGNPGTTTSPVPGGATASIQVSPAGTSTYWVRVTACGVSVDSSAVTVTVNPAPCVAPTIGVHPLDATIAAGETATLSVSVSGTSPTYQWYRGQKDDTSSPVPGGTAASLFVSPASTTSYWVKVSNSCGNASSNAATVTVVPCASVSVTTPTIAALGGGGYQLSVSASGGTISVIQWFVGDTAGGNGTFLGTGATINVFPTQATSYWARANNTCGNSALTSVVRIEPAGVCNAPAISAISATPTTIDSGANVTLSVTATGSSLSYQWYQGAPGVTTAPIPNSNAASITVSPTSTTTYWVRVSSGCGASPANSSGVSVTVNTCTRPAVTSQPSGVTIMSGLKATLTVGASGTGPLTYAWYQGEAGDVSKKVGSAATLTTDRLLATTKFWVRVTNACGSIDSNVVTVSIIPARLRAVRR